MLLVISGTRSSALLAFIRLYGVDLPAFQALAYRIGDAYFVERSAPRYLSDEIIRPYGNELPAFQALAFRSATRIPSSEVLLAIPATGSSALTAFIRLYGIDLPAFQALAFCSAMRIPSSEALLAISVTR